MRATRMSGGPPDLQGCAERAVVACSPAAVETALAGTYPANSSRRQAGGRERSERDSRGISGPVADTNCGGHSEAGYRKPESPNYQWKTKGGGEASLERTRL